MPSILKSRIAIAALAGVFLIPIATSTLRGLTHVLTCSGEVATPFTVVVEQGEDPIVLSTTLLTADAESGLCGGLEVSMQTRAVSDDEVDLTVIVVNETDDPWRGTINLSLGGTGIPITIGRVEAGGEQKETVSLDLQSGESEITGSLLIGP